MAEMELCCWLLPLSLARSRSRGGGSFRTLPALAYRRYASGRECHGARWHCCLGYLVGRLGASMKICSRRWPGTTQHPRSGAALAAQPGALLLLFTPDTTFRHVVPWLLLAATALFALAPQLRRWTAGSAGLPSLLAGRPSNASRRDLWRLLQRRISGIVLLALFGLLGQTRFRR